MDEEKKEQEQPPIIDQLKEYAETNIKLIKLKAVDSSTSVVGSVVADVAIGIGLFIVFVFATITLGFYLSELFESFWKGFGCITLIYLIVVVILIIRKPIIQRTIA